MMFRHHPRLPAHRGTTARVRSVFPYVAEAGLGGRGVYVGRDLHGGPFCHDPFELYARGAVTGPNMVVMGMVGRGKSAFVKTYLWRQSVFGRRSVVIDPKGEYGELSSAFGTRPLRLEPGGSLRLNPFDVAVRSGDRPWDRAESDRIRTALLAAVAEAAVARPLTPPEKAACELALRGAADRGTVTLPRVVEELLRPDEAAAAEIASTAEELASAGREVALELRRLSCGDLRGMLDGPTSEGAGLGGPFTAVDLSALYRSEALGIVMTLVRAWLEARVAAEPGRHIIVLDEAWAVLRNLATARWLQAGFKLARSHGVANICVLHRPSDLLAAGEHKSEQVQLARGLLADAETRVVYGQPEGEVEDARVALGLTDTEAQLLPRLGRGVALWKVGRRSFLVEHRIGRREAAFVDTDAAMRV